MNIPEKLQLALQSNCGNALEDVLVARTDETYEALRSILTAGEDVERGALQNAINLLGRWGDANIVPEIVRLLPQFDAREKINAIDALGRLGSPEAKNAVLEYSNDPDPDVRRFAAYAINRIGGADAVQRLFEMGETDQADFVRAVAKSLLQNRDPPPE